LVAARLKPKVARAVEAAAATVEAAATALVQIA